MDTDNEVAKMLSEIDIDALSEYFEKARITGCYECVRDPDHELTHDFFIIGKSLKKWMVEQDSLEYEPDSPMYSETSFEGLHLKPIVLKTLFKRRLNMPFKIQSTVLPAITADPPRDIIYQSPSGAGKTTALIIAMLNRINENKKCTQILCLSPSLLAAHQLTRRVALYLRSANFYATLTGGEIEIDSFIKRKDLVAHVAVGTAESMLDWLKQMAIDLSNISALMIDDVDFLMKSQECWDDCKKLVKLLPSTCQIVCCSTTFAQSSIKMASDIMKNPDVTILSPTSKCLKTVTQYYAHSSSKDEKYQAICNLYDCILRKRSQGSKDANKIIIFCNGRETAEWLYRRMEADSKFFDTDYNYFKVSLVTGDLKYETDHSLMSVHPNGYKQKKLLDPYDEIGSFISALNRVLITTDILSRAIEYSKNYAYAIVNFELPVNQLGEADFETYVHRISRSGRFDKEATALNLTDTEQSMEVCAAIQEYFGQEVHPLDVNDPNELDLKLWN